LTRIFCPSPYSTGDSAIRQLIIFHNQEFGRIFFRHSRKKTGLSAAIFWLRQKDFRFNPLRPAGFSGFVTHSAAKAPDFFSADWSRQWGQWFFLIRACSDHGTMPPRIGLWACNPNAPRESRRQ
jgi:hypothetical protein